MRWRGFGVRGWRGRAACAAAAGVVLVGFVDRWALDERWLAAAVVLVVLAPMLAVVAVAATPRVAVITVGLQFVLLVCVIVASQVWSSRGPSAPVVDWLLPYTAGAVCAPVVLMVVGRSVRGRRFESLVAVGAVALVVGGCGWFTQGMGGENSRPAATDAAPLLSPLFISAPGVVDCTENSAVCWRDVRLRERDVERVRAVLREHGWSQECRPVTGLLTGLGFDYGWLCLHVAEGRDGVVVTVSGEARWWREQRWFQEPR
ncbi:hypothetical protein [Catellatospora paridis]|uniref:hypothetical protein n=1 Tax=Catellatospora paridis TaxID=1617086 RepID=UPI0012D3A4C0|nr:hypothetical protein [Catellatospora paridis]